jgi:hypothetical protein
MPRRRLKSSNKGEGEGGGAGGCWVLVSPAVLLLHTNKPKLTDGANLVSSVAVVKARGESKEE